MTVNTELSKRIYTGNGVATDYDYDFKIPLAGDLAVSLFDLDGVELPQVLNTDYTVTGAGGDNGGKVLFSVAPPVGYTILLLSDAAYTQPTDFKNQGRFFPETHENALDRAVILARQNREAIARSLTLPPQIEGVSTTLPPPSGLALVGWNESEDALRNFTLSQIATSVVYGDAKSDVFTAAAGQTEFNLTSDPAFVSNMDVSIDGVTQVNGIDFTLDNSGSPAKMVLSSPATLGQVVLVRYMEALPTGVTVDAAVSFTDVPAPAFLKTVSDILNGVPVNILRNIPRNRWAGIQNRTDTEDCADAIMALMDGAFSARVAELRVPVGTFTIHQPIQRLAGSNPFRLVGDDWRRSIIARGSDWAPGVGTGSVFNITGVDNHSIENLRILGGATAYPTNANHAIACSNSNHVTYRRLYIEDWLNSGILVFHFPGLPPPASAQEQNNVIEDCYLVGNGSSNNGILFVDQFYSYIRGCTVRDIGKSGTPQAAIQFKNLCYRSRIDNCIAINARSGFAMGQQDVVGIAAQQCSITNSIARDCVWGVYMGSSAYCDVSNINIDMNNQGSHGIEITDTQECSFTDIKLRGQAVGTGAYSVKIGGTSSDNFVQFSTLNVNDTIPEIAQFDSTALNNMVRVEKLKNAATLTYTDQGVLDNAPTAGNSLEIGGYTTQSAVTIAAGAILLKNPRVQLVRVNTEASAPTDDLDTITGTGRDGQIVTLKTTANSRDVTVKHGTGNIRLVGSADFAMVTINYRITLQFDSGANAWVELSRSASP